MMYTGSGTQACSNMPPPAFNGHGPHHGYPPYVNGPYSLYPNGSYFAPPPNFGPYPHQDHRNFGPVDTRYTQRPKNQKRNNTFSTPPVGSPMPPMNTPTPYMQFDGQFPFQPPMQPYHPFPMLPPNGMMVNQFSNPPPYPPPTPNVINQNQNRNLNGQKFGSFRPTDRQFMNRKQIDQKTKAFHCGSCDKDFSTATRYQQHVAEHVECCLEGCTFRAHPSIVEKHIAMQHRNGLFKRIVKGDTPEDIDKWVTERKKQYPTVGKIEEKEAQKIEMEKRGERYEHQRQRSSMRRENWKREPNHGQRRGLQNRHGNFKGRPNNFRNRRQFPGGDKKSIGGDATEPDSKSDGTTYPPNRISEDPPKKKRRVDELENFEYRRNLPEFRGTKYYLQSETESDHPNYSNSDSEEESLNINVASEESLNVSEASGVTLNITVASSMCEEEDKSVQVRSSLDLIRGYDSSDNDDCDESNTEEEMKRKIPVGSDSDDHGQDECFFKLPLLDNSTKLNSSKLLDTSTEPNALVRFDSSTEPDSLMPDEDDDSGPDECSSKLPVPNFILQDLAVPSNTGIEGVGNITPKLENVDPENEPDASKKEDDSRITKKSTRKRTHKKNKNGKVDKHTELAAEKQDVKGEPESATIIPPRKRYRRPTLLEKLLAPEIRHERNVILQCVRYVVRKNYFDIGSKTSTARNGTL